MDNKEQGSAIRQALLKQLIKAVGSNRIKSFSDGGTHVELCEDEDDESKIKKSKDSKIFSTEFKD